MTGIRQDLVFAYRQMRRSPGFAATAILTLALGIAANVIVFGVLQAMVLQPVNVPRGERVMQLSLALRRILLSPGRRFATYATAIPSSPRWPVTPSRTSAWKPAASPNQPGGTK